ncbi:TPA: MerR family transcriptional regulator, partial [Legionella pneumophila subsp. pneumophila]|nr:MerR family transcriptional regulator [Legionella pneumophila subsp. pneumophila]
SRKYAVCDIALNDDKVSLEAKTWLKSILDAYKM